MSLVNKVIETVSHHVLIQENWKELMKHQDDEGFYRTIVVGFDVDETDIESIKAHFKDHPKWVIKLTFIRTSPPDDKIQQLPLTRINIRRKRKLKNKIPSG